MSAAQHHQRRWAQRKTWLKNLTDADYRFFIGNGETAEDIVHVDCPDDYASLCQKTRCMLQWASAHSYDFVFKCDDDTYVRPDRLLASGFEQHDYSGFIEDRDYPRPHIFPVYPHARGGSGYWLSRKAIDIAAADMPNKRHQEDFAVGEALAQSGLVAHHDERYCHTFSKVESGLVLDLLLANFITLHKCSPHEMRLVNDCLDTQVLTDC